MDKKTLEELANKLMFTMDDSEYDTLAQEFNIILKQMDFVGKIKDIDKVEQLVYPFPLDNVVLRDDEVTEELEIDDILLNSGSNLYNQVKLPKVVE